MDKVDSKNFLYGSFKIDQDSPDDEKFDPLKTGQIFKLDCNHHKAGLYYQGNQFQDLKGFYAGRFMTFIGNNWNGNYSWQDRFANNDLFKEHIMPALNITVDLQSSSVINSLLNLQQIAYQHPLNNTQQELKQQLIADLVDSSLSASFVQKNIGDTLDYSTSSYLTFSAYKTEYLIHSEAIWILQDIYPQQQLHYRVTDNSDLVYIFINKQLTAIIKSFKNRTYRSLLNNKLDLIHKQMGSSASG
jgi:hypothetical protein